MTWTEGPLKGFDLETTGTDPLTALPVSFALVDMDKREVTKRRYGLCDPGVPIPPETTEIHGITDEMVKARGGSLEGTVMGLVGELFAAQYAEAPVVGMNLRYDLTILNTLYAAYNKGQGLRDDGWVGFVIDVSVIDRALDKYRKGGRKLAQLCQHYGVDPGNSHHAGADAEAAVRVALAIADKYPKIANLDIDMLHVQQTAWRRQWVIDFNSYRAKKDQEPIPLEEGNWPLATDEGAVV